MSPICHFHHPPSQAIHINFHLGLLTNFSTSFSPPWWSIDLSSLSSPLPSAPHQLVSSTTVEIQHPPLTSTSNQRALKFNLHRNSTNFNFDLTPPSDCPWLYRNRN